MNTILFDNGIWRITFVKVGSFLKVENLKSGFVDYPIQWPDGRIAWDFPERVPAYIRRKAVGMFKPSRNQFVNIPELL